MPTLFGAIGGGSGCVFCQGAKLVGIPAGEDIARLDFRNVDERSFNCKGELLECYWKVREVIEWEWEWRIFSEAWRLGPGPCLASRSCHALGSAVLKMMADGLRRRRVDVAIEEV